MLTINFKAFAIELILWIQFMNAESGYEIKEELVEPPFGDGTTMVQNIYKKGGEQVYGGAELVAELIPIYQEASANAEDENPDIRGYQDSMRDVTDNELYGNTIG